MNPTINVVKFAPISGGCPIYTGHDYILAGVRDKLKDVPVKCFNTKTGEIVNEFTNVNKCCLSLDTSKDGNLTAFGDWEGVLHLENVHYKQQSNRFGSEQKY